MPWIYEKCLKRERDYLKTSKTDVSRYLTILFLKTDPAEIQQKSRRNPAVSSSRNPGEIQEKSSSKSGRNPAENPEEIQQILPYQVSIKAAENEVKNGNEESFDMEKEMENLGIDDETNMSWLR